MVVRFLRWLFQAICMVTFPFIGLGVGAYLGMWLKEDERNGVDLGIVPAITGFVLGALVAYKVFFREDGSDWAGMDWK